MMFGLNIGTISNAKHNDSYATRNKKDIVALTIIKINTKRDTNFWICMDKDVIYVGIVNNYPNVWPIQASDLEWVQCDCPIAKKGMICKHIVKVFKMLHPNVDDNIMVCEVGTKYNVQHNTLMTYCYMRLL